MRTWSNRNTGAVETILEPPKLKIPNIGDYTMLFNSKIPSLFQLSGSELKVMLWICKEMEFENKITLNQVETSKAIGISRKTVGIAIKALVKRDILKELKSRPGLPKNYEVCPYYLWRGKAWKCANKRRETESMQKALKHNVGGDDAPLD